MKPPKSKPAIESGALIESASISKRPAPLKQQNKKLTYKHTCWRNTKITKKYKTTLKPLILTYLLNEKLSFKSISSQACLIFNSEIQMPTQHVLRFYNFIYK